MDSEHQRAQGVKRVAGGVHWVDVQVLSRLVADPRPTERPTADRITAVVAARVRELRERSGLRQADLARKMAELGIPWKRGTVVNLEKRAAAVRDGAPGRDAVTAQELLALARVFDVPLPWLLVDPEAGTAVPIAKGVEADAWTALLWLVGKQALTDPPGPAWDHAALPIRQACQVATLVERFGQLRTHRENVAALLPDGQDADRAEEDERQERRVLEDLTRPLSALLRLGYPPPPLPDDLIKRAADLGVELDGEG